MSDIKIMDLPEKTDNPKDDDLLVIEDSEDTKKVSLIKLKGALSMDSIIDTVKNALESKITEFLNKHSSRMSELEKKNYDLETLCHNLENDHDHDAERITELEEQLKLYKSKEEELTNDKKSLVKRVSELERIRGVLEEEIKSLKSKIDDDESKIVIHKSKITDLQKKVKDLNTLNEELKKTISETNKTLEKKNQQDFDNANAKIDQAIDELKEIIKFYHHDATFN